MRYCRYCLTLAVLLIVAGCSASKPSDTTAAGSSIPATTVTATVVPTTTLGQGVDPPALAGSSWRVTEYLLDGSITNVWDDWWRIGVHIEVTMDFTDVGVSGSSGCNDYSASYETEGVYDPFEEGIRDENDGQVIRLGLGFVTSMACTPERIMDQEADFLGLLPQAGRWLIAREELSLRSADGSFLLKAEPAGQHN